MRRMLPLLPLLTACATIRAAAPRAPLVDYHQHLVSPAFAPLVKLPARDGRALLAELDAATVRKIDPDGFIHTIVGTPGVGGPITDVATVVTAESTPDELALVARRIRQVGTQRALYGSDLSPPGGSVRAGWEIFRNRTPLTAAELQTIAENVTRFAR